jgi:hypothetical protein
MNKLEEFAVFTAISEIIGPYWTNVLCIWLPGAILIVGFGTTNNYDNTHSIVEIHNFRATLATIWLLLPMLLDWLSIYGDDKPQQTAHQLSRGKKKVRGAK